MEFWSETLDLNSELSQFDIEDDADEDDALDDPSLPKITVPIDIRGEVELKSAREYLNEEAKVEYDLLKCINKRTLDFVSIY